MQKKKPYYIIETAFHHEGDVVFLNSLIDSFDDIGADAIKFHLLFNVEDYMVANHPAIDTLKKISIPENYWIGILEKVKNSSKEIILLCNDLESLQYANSIQDMFTIIAVEIHSTGLNDIYLLNECSKFNKTIILGTGGSSFDEVQFAVDYLKKIGKYDLLLMHGFQNYPTDYSDINLSRMNLLKYAFNLPVGYADHTDPQDKNDIFISILPLISGFNVIEKHVTNVFDEKRIDSQAAVSLQKMKDIISLGNEIWKTVGENNYELSDAEKKYGNTGPMKKAIVARENISKNDVISLEKIAFKRTETSSPLLQKDVFKIIGSPASKNILKDEILTFDNVNYEFKKENFNQFFVK